MVGAHFGLTPSRYQSGETDYPAGSPRSATRVSGGALRGGQRHPDPQREELGPEDLGPRRRQARRDAQGEGRAGPQTRRRAAPDAARPDRLRRPPRRRPWPPRQGDDNPLGGRLTIASRSEVPSPGRWITSGRNVRSSATATAPNVRSAGGSSANTIEQRHRSTADRSKPPAKRRRSRD